MFGSTPEDKLVINAAQMSHRKFFPLGPFVSISLGQYGLESDWGKKPAAPNNYWGIQANRSQIAEGMFKTTESFEYVEGRRIQVWEKFAAFKTLQDGFDAHARLLSSAHYALCTRATSVEEYCYALKRCNYATAPTYPVALMEIIRSAGLEQYDTKLV